VNAGLDAQGDIIHTISGAVICSRGDVLSSHPINVSAWDRTFFGSPSAGEK